jgi:hypothetical protein
VGNGQFHNNKEVEMAVRERLLMRVPVYTAMESSNSCQNAANLSLCSGTVLQTKICCGMNELYLRSSFFLNVTERRLVVSY